MNQGGRIYISIDKKRKGTRDGSVHLNGNNFTTEQVDDILREMFHDKEKLNITHLYLNRNQLDAVPEAIKSLTNLKELYLSVNQIQRIPGWIWKLSKLERLYADRNNLREIPSSIEKLSNLKELWLSCNNLSVLPLTLKNLTNLKIVDFSGNPLLADACSIFIVFTAGDGDCQKNHRWRRLLYENALTVFRSRARQAAVTWILIGKQLGLCRDVVILIAKFIYSTRKKNDIWE